MDPYRNNIELASGGKRLVAYLVDGFINGIIGAILYIVTIMPDIMKAASDFLNQYISEEEYVNQVARIIYSEKMFLIYLTLVGISFLYYVVAAYTLKGATLGKKLIGITAVEEDGSPIGFWKLFLRELLKTLLGGVSCGIVTFISFFMVISSSKKAVHDIIARTAVIEVRSKSYL